MFQYYDEERKVKSCEPVSIRDFISQPDGDVWGWFNEYIKYGGISEIHDIVPYYELQENAKLLEYAESEKEKQLAVYGVIATIMSLLQALFCGVGQAIQPLVSANFGAMQIERIRKIWKYSLITVLLMGVLFMTAGELMPLQITKLFMDADESVLKIVPGAFRLHFTVYLFLGMTVLAAYYLQSIMKETASIIVGFSHSVILTSAACYLLPALMGMDGVWLALPVAEMLIAAIAVMYISRLNTKL